MSSVKKGNPPDYNVRAKVNDYWMTIGAAWKVKDDGISVRLNAVPVGEWDGSVLLMKPLEEKGEGDAAE